MQSSAQVDPLGKVAVKGIVSFYHFYSPGQHEHRPVRYDNKCLYLIYKVR